MNIEEYSAMVAMLHIALNLMQIIWVNIVIFKDMVYHPIKCQCWDCDNRREFGVGRKSVVDDSFKWIPLLSLLFVGILAETLISKMFKNNDNYSPRNACIYGCVSLLVYPTYLLADTYLGFQFNFSIKFKGS